MTVRTRVRQDLKYLAHAAQGLFAKVHPNPLFVLGNQKSGTTAIAAMLAEAAGRSVSLDLRREIREPTIPLVLGGDLSIEDFVLRHRIDFAREIVKEPGLTLLYPQLAGYFPSSRFVFIVRNPADNIRSIMNRLDLAGDQQSVPTAQGAALSQTWRSIVFGDEDPATANPVACLSDRWSQMAEMYLANKDRIVLIRYEDFVADKQAVLEAAVTEVGWSVSGDATALFDKQFQSRGDRNVTLGEFFGDNVDQINTRCSELARRFGYDPLEVS